VGGTCNMHGDMRNVKGNQPEDLYTRGTTDGQWILKKQGVRVWTGFNWLKTGSSGGLL